MVLEVFERWAAALDARGLHEVPGVAFLRLWLRRGNLEPVLLRELGPDSVRGGRGADRRARMRAPTLGGVCHLPARKIATQPAFCLSFAFLRRKGCLGHV